MQHIQEGQILAILPHKGSLSHSYVAASPPSQVQPASISPPQQDLDVNSDRRLLPPL